MPPSQRRVHTSPAWRSPGWRSPGTGIAGRTICEITHESRKEMCDFFSGREGRQRWKDACDLLDQPSQFTKPIVINWLLTRIIFLIHREQANQIEKHSPKCERKRRRKMRVRSKKEAGLISSRRRRPTPRPE